MKAGFILIGLAMICQPRVLSGAMSGSKMMSIPLCTLQHGGKAEPNKITFARGASSATVTGSVKGDEEYEYSFDASKDQKVRIAIKSVPEFSVVPELMISGGAPVDLRAAGKGVWTCVLPEREEYLLTARKARQDRRTSHYSLTLSIN